MSSPYLLYKGGPGCLPGRLNFPHGPGLLLVPPALNSLRPTVRLSQGQVSASLSSSRCQDSQASARARSCCCKRGLSAPHLQAACPQLPGESRQAVPGTPRRVLMPPSHCKCLCGRSIVGATLPPTFNESGVCVLISQLLFGFGLCPVKEVGGAHLLPSSNQKGRVGCGMEKRTKDGGHMRS